MIGEVLEVGGEQVTFSGGKPMITAIKLKVGDTIVYPQYHSNSFSWDGQEYKLVSFENIIAVIEG